MTQIVTVVVSEQSLRGGRLKRLLVAGMIACLLPPLASAAASAATAGAEAGSAMAAVESEVTAYDLIAAAIDLTRGATSHSEMTMLVHRPTWERTTNMVAWTRGRDDALIRFTAPAKDAGNATLKQGDKMWTYTPKLRRTIRLPFSLMSQSWGGSDFSYNDLSRTDNLLRHYDLEIIKVEANPPHTFYTIEAVPHDDAPIVWGKEEWVLRDDSVLISQTFFDQALIPLKRMEALEIGELGGRVFATRMRITKLDESDRYTEFSYDSMTFDVELDDRTFTVFTLQSGADP